MTHRLLVPVLLSLCSSLAFAELDPGEINGYFNPGPDAYTDLDAFIDLNHQSDMADTASVVDIELDFDYLQLDLDTQVEFDANGELTLTKDDAATLILPFDTNKELTQHHPTASWVV